MKTILQGVAACLFAAAMLSAQGPTPTPVPPTATPTNTPTPQTPVPPSAVLILTGLGATGVYQLRNRFKR
jgi:hypothetical protein